MTPNAAVSRNLCGICFVVKWSDSDTTKRIPRKLSVCTALLGYFLAECMKEYSQHYLLFLNREANSTRNKYHKTAMVAQAASITINIG